MSEEEYVALQAKARKAMDFAVEMGCEAAVQLNPQEFINLIAKAKEADFWKRHAQTMQSERAVLSDKLNGTPCAEIRWRALLAKADKVLEPFAEYAEFVSRNHPGWDHDEFATSLPDAWANDLAVQRFAVYRAARSIRDEIKDALK